jgi:acyl dehydratase
LKISESMAGTKAAPRAHEIDARWLMAYAAALEETAPEYFDTSRRDGILAHPLFPVCYEWPSAVELRSRLTSEAVAARSVHATHDLVIHRPVQAGDRLETTATVTAVEARSPGAYVVTRFDTVTERGEPVTTTEYGSIYRGVAVDPHPSPLPGRSREKGALTPLSPQRRGQGEGWSNAVSLPTGLPHIYTECARIWNPIHTDRAVALGAGLPDIILHGTATLALGVSQVLRREGADAARRVRRVACRFTGMVRLPSTITVRSSGDTSGPAGRAIAFEVLTEDGRPALRDGLVVIT